MDGTFIRELVNVTSPTIEMLNGIEYASKSFSPIMPPMPTVLAAHSLTAVVDYCQNELELDETYIIHVREPGEVLLFSRLLGAHRHRECLLRSSLICDIFEFDREHSVEKFVIAMQAQFIQDETTEKILALVGNITAEAKSITEDDGVTQRVTAKAGIVKTEEREVPNPVVLRPFRTFQEIEQPASKFVLRVNASGPRCALYEADGGAWKNEAIVSIRNWLAERLKELVENGVVTIIA